MKKDLNLIRLVDLEKSGNKEDFLKAKRIRARQKNKTMKKYKDILKYACFDENEYDLWESKKVGRPNKK